MTPDEAIKIIKKDLEHTRSHLQDKNKAPEFYEEMKSWEQAEEMAIKALEKRPHGEWTIIRSPLSNETVVKCPFCKDEFIGNDVEDYNFCPICGAEMHQEEKDT